MSQDAPTERPEIRLRFDPTNRLHVLLRLAYGDGPFSLNFMPCRFVGTRDGRPLRAPRKGARDAIAARA